MHCRTLVVCAVAVAALAVAGGSAKTRAPHRPRDQVRDSVRLLAGDVIAVVVPDGIRCERRFVQLSRDTTVVVEIWPQLPCRPAVAVFRHGMGVIAIGPGRGWTAVGPSPVRPIAVPVRFIVATESPSRGLEWIGPWFADLQQEYEANQVGIAFVAADTEVVENPPGYLLQGCDSGAVAQFVHSKYYRPDTLNVVLLDSIVGFTKQEGLTCFLQVVDGRPATNVTFIALSFQTDATFPHEVGHALGLQGNTCGHVDMLLDKPGCQAATTDNLMMPRQGWMDPSLYLYRDHFTRGQVYRMIYDSNSFLNLARLRRDAPVVTCQKSCCVIDPSAPNFGCVGDPGTPCLRLADDDPGGTQ